MAPRDPLTVRTHSGLVRGTARTYGAAFFGVPYAETPVAAERFTRPTPRRSWRGTLDATQPGATAPQPARGRFGALDMTPYFGPGWLPGTDYLTANIYRPTPGDMPAPVMVFVHGGGFVAGSGAAPLYRGDAFARDGIVLVTLNYRLGVAGFLHLPDAPDNRGLLDVLAALRWVQDNIGRFGGDPANVTLFGQSAGAILAGAILADPAGNGLFRRAILQSGSGTAAFSTEQAAVVSAALGRHFDLEPSAASLAELTDGQLVDVVPALTGLDLATATRHDPLGGITPLSVVLSQQPADAVAAGTGAQVDLLIGSNTREGSLYLAPTGLLAGSSHADLLKTAAAFHNQPEEAVRKYRAERPAATTADLRTAILGDGLFGNGTHRMAAAHASRHTRSTFVYEFDWPSDALDGQLGAGHTVELPFVFDNTNLPSLRGPNALLGTNPPPPGFAARVHGAWVHFAAAGNPGWDPYDTQSPTVQQISPGWGKHEVSDA
jgi:para-nitrobenzyl esterase